MEETGALAGKVAVVTGATRNIGRAIALALGGEGAAVLVNALSDAKAAGTVAGEVTAAGGRGLAHLADVTDEAAANGMADAAVHAFGRIDILVCNAGIRRQHPFTEVSFAEWRDVLAVTLDGTFLCAKAKCPVPEIRTLYDGLARFPARSAARRDAGASQAARDDAGGRGGVPRIP